MKRRRTGLFVFVLLLSISAVSVLGTALFVNSGKNKSKSSGKLTIVTSFYPVYISAMNVTDGADVDLENLTEPSTGCLHDYTLTPKDMKLLSTADIFLVNGGGIENFLTDVAESYPNLKIIDLSRNFTDEELEQIHEAGGETDEQGEANAHYWMSVTLLKTQVDTMAKGLADADPANASLYQSNAEAYEKELEGLQAKEKKVAGKLSNAVIFHAAFYYLCQDLNCQVAYTLDLDEERQVSAGETRDTADALKTMSNPVILAEKTYGQEMAERMQTETGCKVIYLDPLTRSNGNYEKDAYLKGMEENLAKIEAAIGQ
ncbi:MAG: metal ABC transporter substrate-binding protein [Lachnospiraceae bacterium]|nr:metal ABC transporter substrate-binding protein [Lachnospiraceae bacterium]